MQPETVRTTMSMYDMFADSDIFMKLLVIGLLFASFWSWSIIFDKVMLFRRMRERMKAFEERFWSGGSLESLYNAYAKNPSDPLSSMFVSAIKEWRRSMGEKRANSTINMEERIEKVMQISIDKQVDKMETKMTFLASTGAVAPFLGLFGTVWGIMDSFTSIGAAQNVSLATVAPGIAEALFTTAIGLIAAIPALIGYNKLTSDIDRLSKKMETFSDELGTIISRQIEQAEK